MTETMRRIRELMDERDINQVALSRITGVTQPTVSQWFSGERNPPLKRLRTIAEYFGVTVDYLIGGTEYNFIRMPQTAPRKAAAPLVGRVHAGDGSDPDVLDGSVPVPFEVWERHQDAFLLEVEGDCMNLVIPPGCMVLVDPAIEPGSGSLAVVSVDGSDYLVRRVTRGASSLMLSPESTNPAWKDVVVAEGDGHVVELVGTVVWYQPSRELS
jgi:repressor LexA